MKSFAPSFEVIVPSFGSSFTYTSFTEKINNKSDIWHYHPEIELVYVNGGSGKRQIGTHISYYTDGDLILIGSNLPHCGFTNEETGNTVETVIQMKPNFLGDDFWDTIEMRKIQKLIDQARMGIAFDKNTKLKVGALIESMHSQSPFERLLQLLHILNELALSRDSILLNAAGFSLETQVQDNDKINVIFNYVKDRFFEPIPLEDVAKLVSMTVPSFCRFFKKITNKTFTAFVNEYRLVHACKLLAEKPISITEICYESGFNNFSHFNKSFKAYTGKSASQYRNELKHIIK